MPPKDRLRVRALPSLRPVAEHRAAVAALLSRTPVESRPLAACLGLVLAEDLHARISLPPFDNSAMDGYAVLADDVADASPESPVVLPVAEDVPAGRTDSPALRPGTAHRIMTGAPVPPGADAIVQVEFTDGGVERVAVHQPKEPGAHIRRAGEDVRAGARVLGAGTRLGAAELGLAAAVGAGELPVHRPPRVLVLSTGSELVEPGKPLLHGQIYESNGVMLAAAVEQAGCSAELLRFVPDDVEEFHAALTPHLSTVDLVLTSGGVSAGAYEVVKDAFSGQGVEFVKVAMQPGMPQGAGVYRGVPVITLPGNPVSSLVSFEVFVRPALRAAAGDASPERPARRARLTEALRSAPGKRQYRRGFHDADAGTVSVVGGPGSHLLSALTTSNCLMEIDENDTELVEGTEVTVLLTR
ncbi:molybdopterin molybdotransferase MoeA [Allokutzneria albata]|uniref:Molybdopterin molybdenumtransferase n=1 Tax=Allokutzneria albata TaxID=211114 RepID=A0A1H0AVV7_ALLAB|nr:gephyrin-like molybdotransferase Glp [Allokutzneria albata]SDN37183.1 molybdopterin molybdochelatase [Allokutzneria albata]